ncbi:MAG TPA: hypothetical protein DCQ32_04480 [Cyanobacteria bacterium UBA8156]|nr:hypothetical protein [Cyanobacteria bacterium UBA8156]
MKRRDFLGLAIAATTVAAWPVRAEGQRRTLLVVELVGGNDGLNTFIPYRDSNYRRLRPQLAIADGLPVSERTAWHPALAPLLPQFRAGRVAVVQNVGYPNPSLSHFRSRDIWLSGRPESSATSGWLARALGRDAEAVFVGEEYPLALLGENDERFLQVSARLLRRTPSRLDRAIAALYETPQGLPASERVRQAVQASRQALARLQQEATGRSQSSGYPSGAIGQQFALVGRLLETQPQVVYLTVGGWDTHANQRPRHQNLLSQLATGLTALQRHLQAQGRQNSVLTLIHSEFGRRPAENGSGGTDHGTAGSVMLLGPVRGGLYGGEPALDRLVDGNLPVGVDYRQVFGEVLTKWLGRNPQGVLGQPWPALGVLG